MHSEKLNKESDFLIPIVNLTAFLLLQTHPSFSYPVAHSSQLSAFPEQVLHYELQISHLDAINELPDAKKYPSLHDVQDVSSVQVIH